MISAPNHRQLSSGNKLILLACLVLSLAACSKKTVPVKPAPPAEKPPVSEAPKAEEPKKEIWHSVALLLPFHLEQIHPASADKKEINRAELAIDYYQGFKFALDSLASQGNNFRLKVFDSQEQEVRVVNLAMSASVTDNDLIVGPVFPESVKTFGEFAKLKNSLQVSPLAAAMPSQFNNPNLLTVTNTIDQHGFKVADFIKNNYKAQDINLLIINTRRSDDEKFASPVRKYLKTLPGSAFTFKELPNAIGLEKFLSTSKTNVIIIASTSRSFVIPVIDRLYKLSQANFRIEIFGHPNWLKVQFLNAEKLQMLNTRITSSYFVNYKSPAVKDFVKNYRTRYRMEPSEYAFKAFDTALFLGKMLARYGSDYPKHLTQEQYQGLSTSFRFRRNENTGFLNENTMLLQYRGFELQVIK